MSVYVIKILFLDSNTVYYFTLFFILYKIIDHILKQSVTVERLTDDVTSKPTRKELPFGTRWYGCARTWVIEIPTTVILITSPGLSERALKSQKFCASHMVNHHYVERGILLQTLWYPPYQSALGSHGDERSMWINTCCYNQLTRLSEKSIIILSYIWITSTNFFFYNWVRVAVITGPEFTLGVVVLLITIIQRFLQCQIFLLQNNFLSNWETTLKDNFLCKASMLERAYCKTYKAVQC